jgi:hypothetical protein
MADREDLVGVRGWLAFFVVILAVITPLRATVATYTNLYDDPSLASFYGNAWPMLEALEWALVAAAVVGAWFLAWRLVFVQVWATVRMVIAGIWILSLGFVALEILLVSIVGDIPFGPLVAAVTLDVVRALIFGAIWTTYFLQSKRVAKTYPRHTGREEMAEVFG